MIEGQARRSGVFLLELMISILFFCIAAAVGLQLFVKSHCISEDAGNMNMAVHKAAAAAEVFRSETDMEDYLKEEYSYYEKEDNTFLVSFTADWENCKTKDAEYTLWITLGEAEQRMVGHFAVKQKDGEKDKIIYEVELKRVISQREAAEDE